MSRCLIPADARVISAKLKKAGLHRRRVHPEGSEDKLWYNRAMTNRPTSFDNFIGQRHLTDNLKVILGAAKHRQDPAPHMLFMGPAGLGKTSLANLIATEMGSNMTPVLGTLLKREVDIASILTGLLPYDVLFIDEIHALPRKVSEILYTAVEDFLLDIVVGQRGRQRPVRLLLPPFTLVGATTHPGGISGPLRDRFGFTGKLSFYTPSELDVIIQRASKAASIDTTLSASAKLASSSRGTPRVALRLWERARDISQSNGFSVIGADIAQAALDLCGVDSLGLDQTDLAVLKLLAESPSPVGLSTLADSLGEEESTIEEMVEPYLLRLGFMVRMSKGRSITQAGADHLLVGS